MIASETAHVRPAPAELALLAALVVAPLLPAPWSLLFLAVLAAAWCLSSRGRRRELTVAGPALLLAVVALAAGWLASRPRTSSLAGWQEAAQSEYRALWERLDSRAQVVTKALARTPRSAAARRTAFDALSHFAAAEEGRLTLLLVDGDGEAKAWMGSGLVHEPGAVELPRAGRAFRAGFLGVTLLSVSPLDGERRPWRVVVGMSLPSDRLPFSPPGGEPATAYRWSLVEHGAPASAQEGLRLEGEALPDLVLAPRPAPEAFRPEIAEVYRRGAWAALAVALLAIVVLRGVGWALVEGLSPRTGASLGLLAVLATAAAARASGASLPAWAALVAAVAALAVGCLAVHRPSSAGSAIAGGAAAAAGGLAAAFTFEVLAGRVDLGSAVAPGPEIFCLRLAGTALLTGLLLLLARRSPLASDDEGAPQLGAALTLVLSAAAVVDLAELAVPLLLGAGACLGFWLHGRTTLRAVGTLAPLLATAALLAAASWEVSDRFLLRREVREATLSRMGPPSAAEMRAVAADIEVKLAALDLESFTIRNVAGMARGDLAYAIWRELPLAQANALSAVKVVPHEGEPEIFSFGLPAENGADLATSRVALQEQLSPAWDERQATGETVVRAGGRAWGTVEWRLVPRPGFSLPATSRAEAVLLALLRGAPGDPRAPVGLPPTVEYALYPPSGRALVAPWPDLPPAPPALRKAARFVGSTPTPSGRAWASTRQGEDGLEVLYLPQVVGFAALERVGTNATSVALFLALSSALALLLALPRPAVRDLLAKTVRSYSRRLILIYTALLLLPLLLLAYVLLAAVEASLEGDQRSRGEQAVTTAQREIVERILAEPPGFGIDTTLSPAYLKRLARQVDHDVNVYFGADFLSSSTGELFTAGLLPRRIPGEVFRELVLDGYGIADRTIHAFGADYLELYAPVALPGEAAEDPRIFLSVPLLAQQEDMAAVLGALRRQALVVSTALFALLVVVGGRLARNFTKPLQELVAGTRRIAAGASALDLAPSELELKELVEAVDEMARRIAQSRGELLREKEVVERMVESITSGVVSLDAEGRVLLSNRVASTLLGVRIGGRLEQSLRMVPRLEPIARFVAENRRGAADTARETVRVAAAEGGEREWTLIWVPLPGLGEPSALLVAEDVTEVFRGQRLAAWAEMARIIAHEIKNPLTPVRLSAEHMQRVWASDPEHFGEIFERCTANILQQVEELQEIASEFSTYSRIPRIDPRPGDLAAAMVALAEGYRTSPPPGLRVEVAAPGEPLLARFDAKLLSRAVRNLLENAVRAALSPAGQGRPGGGLVALAVARVGGSARVAVLDNGPGVAPELLPRIFDPYFSTHDTGTGLGLPIARRIAEEHGGSIAAANRDGGGLEVEIRIPLL